MNELFGIPMDTLLVVLAVVLATVGGRARRPRAAKPRAAQARRPQRRPPPRTLGADRRRAHARHDDHRGRARDRRHDEPHDSLDRDPGPRRDRRGRLRQGRGRGHPRRARAGLGHRLLPAGDRRPRAREFSRARTSPTASRAAIREDVAVQAPVQRQTEPSVSLFAPDPTRMKGFAPIRNVEGGEVTLADLRPVSSI